MHSIARDIARRLGHRRPGIKLKLALGSTLACLGVLMAVTLIHLGELRQSFREAELARQQSIVELVAAELGHKFALRRDALTELAARVGDVFPADGRGSARAAQRVLDEQGTTLRLFDAFFVLRTDGSVLAHAPFHPGREKLNASDRAYFRQVLATGRTVISEPVDAHSGSGPIVVFAAPIRNAASAVDGVLVGSVSVLRAGFLGELIGRPNGTAAYISVISRGADPRIVVHPDTRRIMTTPRRVGVIGRALDGEFEGAEATENSAGESTLRAVKRMAQPDWLVVSSIPTASALAPLAAAERRLALRAFIVALFLLPLAWLVSVRLLAPLERLRDEVKAMRQGEGQKLAIPDTGDEVADLATAFCELLETKRLADAAVRSNEAMLRTLNDNVPALVAYVDCEERYRYANAIMQRWRGFSARSILGRTVEEVVSPEEYAVVGPYCKRALAGEEVQFEREATLPFGKRHLHATHKPDIDAAGNVLGFFVLAYDITARREAELALSHRVHHDALTGLPNRTLFQERLERLLAAPLERRSNSAVMFLDIDHFKRINDTHGHAVGDQALKAFGRRLAGSLRPSDLAARLSGDEFAVVLDGTFGELRPERIAARILEEVRRPVRLEGGGLLDMTASIGIAHISASTDAASELLRLADRALYAAKARGRDTFAVFDQGLLVGHDLRSGLRVV